VSSYDVAAVSAILFATSVTVGARLDRKTWYGGTAPDHSSTIAGEAVAVFVTERDTPSDDTANVTEAATASAAATARRTGAKSRAARAVTTPSDAGGEDRAAGEAAPVASAPDRGQAKRSAFRQGRRLVQKNNREQS
jgi:hypothetical protein